MNSPEFSFITDGYQRVIKDTQRDLRLTRKELGRAGQTIYFLRCEVAMLRDRENVSNYYDTLASQHSMISKYASEVERLQRENDALTKQLANQDV